VVACVLLLGCEESKLPKSWRVTYARVLAVRAEVIGDEARATPEPGERVRVSVLIAGEQPIEQVSYALLICPASPPRGELPSCAGEPIAVDRGRLSGAASSARELIYELEVPRGSELGGAERLLFAGTICTDGNAEPVEGGEGRCVDGDVAPVTFAAHVTLALGGAGINHNPVLTDDALRFDEAIWPPSALLDAASDDDAGADDAGAEQGTAADAGAAPSARADDEEHTIAISLQDSAREVVDGVAEELLLSHFVTVGVLERRFSVLEREQDGATPLLLKWHMPRRDDPPPRAFIVFVLRDQRGGVAYTLREVAIE
jgi:hypothetical protein